MLARFTFIAFLFLLTVPCRSQNLIIHPSIGDTIDRDEKRKFMLFPFYNTEDFSSGVFRKDKSELLLIITGTKGLDTIPFRESDYLHQQKTIYSFLGESVPTAKTIPSKVFERKKNSLFAEFLGASFIFSSNYSRIVYQNKSVSLEPRVGILLVPGLFTSGVTVGGIVGTDVIIGMRKHSFESGIAVAGISGAMGYSVRLGYRYNSYNGFLFRAGVTPLLIFEGIVEFIPVMPSICIGKTF